MVLICKSGHSKELHGSCSPVNMGHALNASFVFNSGFGALHAEIENSLNSQNIDDFWIRAQDSFSCWPRLLLVLLSSLH